MKIVKCSWFPPKGYSAITLIWWLIVKEGYNVSERLITHETIHSKQQKEMLILPFFIWYGVEFLVRLIQYRNWHTAYRNISFEREAYANEGNKEYLSKRKLFSWIHYIKK